MSIRIHDEQTAAEPIGQEVRKLIADWKADRRPTSLAVKMADHPAYRRIVELGKADPGKVVPVLLAELEARPDHWFIALHAITGAEPVPEASRGRLGEMAAAWVDWGRRNGFEW